MSTLTKTAGQLAIDLFARFQMNYPHDFIKHAFAGWMADHLQSKFNHIYNQHGAKAAIIMFWIELDCENQETLSNYILTYYEQPGI